MRSQIGLLGPAVHISGVMLSARILVATSMIKSCCGKPKLLAMFEPLEGLFDAPLSGAQRTHRHPGLGGARAQPRLGGGCSPP